MLFHTDVIRRFGVPDEELVLYADDTEYSGRISRGGGSILLVRDALIRDSEPSWNTDDRYSNSLAMLLRSEGDWRVYYSVRNNLYLATHVWPANRVLRWLNRQVFVALLWIGSKALRRSERYHLLRRAIVDGEKRILGICPEFPLP
jgi:GT2 family glycosyltransferase